MANGPWAAVLVVCAPLVAIVIMFVCALVLVPRRSRVDAIHAMAELVRALRPRAPTGGDGGHEDGERGRTRASRR